MIPDNGNDEINDEISKVKVLMISKIEDFYLPNKKRDNDKKNKNRENMIVAIANGKIPDTWFDDFQYGQRWRNLEHEIKKFEKINSPISYDKAHWIKKAGRKYKYDFEVTYISNGEVVKTRNIEFKNNVMSVKGCPQFVSPMNPSQYIIYEKTYEEFFYDKYLPEICETFGRDIPKKEDWLKQINGNKSSCLSDVQSKYYKGSKCSSKYTGEEGDIQFYNLCKEVSKKSFCDFHEKCKLDCDKLNDYLQSSQKGKEYMLYYNGYIFHETMDTDDYTIDPTTIKVSSPCFKGKTVSGKKISILHRWKNGNGIAFPAFQIT